MAFYEHTFIGKQDLSDKEVDKLVTKYSDQIKQYGKILKTEKLSPEDRSAAIVVLRKKCEIIINGFRKRGKLQEIERYEKIANQHQIF